MNTMKKYANNKIFRFEISISIYPEKYAKMKLFLKLLRIHPSALDDTDKSLYNPKEIL